jgi:isocitrate dehydrogenase
MAAGEQMKLTNAEFRETFEGRTYGDMRRALVRTFTPSMGAKKARAEADRLIAVIDQIPDKVAEQLLEDHENFHNSNGESQLTCEECRLVMRGWWAKLDGGAK